MSNFPERAEEFLTRAEDLEDNEVAQAKASSNAVTQLVMLRKGEPIDLSSDSTAAVVVKSFPGKQGVVQSINGAGEYLLLAGNCNSFPSRP